MKNKIRCYAVFKSYRKIGGLESIPLSILVNVKILLKNYTKEI